MRGLIGLILFFFLGLEAYAKPPSLHACVRLIRETIHHMTYKASTDETFLPEVDAALEKKINALGDLSLRPPEKIKGVVDKYISKIPDGSSKNSRAKEIKIAVAKKILASKKRAAVAHTMDLVKSQYRNLSPVEMLHIEKGIVRLVEGKDASPDDVYIADDIRLSASLNLELWSSREIPYSKELFSTSSLSTSSPAWPSLRDISFNSPREGEKINFEIPRPKPEDVSPLIRPLIDFDAPPKQINGQSEIRFNVNANNLHQVADQLANLGPKTAQEYRQELRTELAKNPTGFEKKMSDFIPEHARQLLGKNTDANCAGAAAYFLGLTSEQKVLLPDEAASLFNPKYEVVKTPRMGDVVVYTGFGNRDHLRHTYEVFGVDMNGYYSNQSQFRHVAIYMGDKWVWQTPTYHSNTPVIFSNYNEANSGVPTPPGQVYYLRRKPSKP